MLRSVAHVDAAAPTMNGAASSEAATPRPPLKWAGGKRWQVPVVEKYWAPHSHQRLVEPFCGGLAVALGLKPARALLNDVNPHLINFYRQLKAGLAPTEEIRNAKRPYYAAREEFNHLLASGRGNTKRAAELFYYLNRTGYNGLCRFNRKGEFNVPFGRYKTINYFRTQDFRPYVETFRDWEFTNTDFDEVPLAPEDFVYADPPYDVEFTHYSQGGFSWDDQVRTARWLAKHPGPVVLSNQATPAIKELYKSLGYALQILHAPRRISCTGDRTPAAEVLATRNLPT
ncbi:MAG TPA: Dam family site-specific DNA-(adenine-N6)-methyltransferase [Vicinamibacterales bacterium]|nr:Dam family site-specific DNA-(adenine-N6)-methyltransferase [Vicinamibacterales bacterium]